MAESEDQSMIPKDEVLTDFGNRLDYSKPKYRDLWCGVIYYVHLIAMVALTGYFFSSAIDRFTVDNPETETETKEEELKLDVEIVGALVAILCCSVLGLLLGFCWLAVIKRYAMSIIKTMIFLNISLWIVVGIVGFATIILPIFACIMVLFWLLYLCCMWKRIKFASVLLGLGARIIEQFTGTVCVTLTMIVLTLTWFVIWFICFILYVISTAPEGETPTSDNMKINSVVLFVLFISLYWVTQVNTNISHTTSCGVAASWYFKAPDEPISGTIAAFKRSMTTSFGSICFGSLIVAVLQAIKAIISVAEGRKEGNSCILCLIKCCVVCIEKCINWFNTYAFAHCAIYGVSFLDGARQTFDLLLSRGILAIINEDISGMALGAGSLVSGILCGLLGFGIGTAFYVSDSGVNDAMITGLATYGAVVGLIFTWLVLSNVRSAIICLFVCFAEEPAVLYQNRREDFDELAGVKDDFQQVYEKYGQKSV